MSSESETRSAIDLIAATIAVYAAGLAVILRYGFSEPLSDTAALLGISLALVLGPHAYRTLANRKLPPVSWRESEAALTLTALVIVTAAGLISRSTPPHDTPQDDRSTCVSAARWAFERVAIIESDATGRTHTRWLVCGP